jgi:RimJ/RimL family protein N-acetyltransferase
MVEDEDGVVIDFVSRHLPGGDRGFGKASAIGYVEQGQLVGGTVFHNYDPEAGVVELTTAATSPRWLTRQTLHAIFAIPFDQWGCQMIVLRVAASNVRMVRIAQRYGFDGVLVPRLAGRREGVWIFTLTDDAWRATALERRRHG